MVVQGEIDSDRLGPGVQEGGPAVTGHDDERPPPEAGRLSPRESYRELLTKGEDVIAPETWAGSLPAAYGIAPRLRIGANRWFNLLWLIPIGVGLLLVAIASAQKLREMPGIEAFVRSVTRALASPCGSRRLCRRGRASSTSSTCS